MDKYSKSLFLIPSFLSTDYENVMGRIVAVNLAHWRKDQEKRSIQQQQDKREYQENVQEMIETTNEGTFQTLFLAIFHVLLFLLMLVLWVC